MTIPDDLATARALAALDKMAEQWSEEVALLEMAAIISRVPPSQLTEKIVVLVKQAFVEGAYRCYDDARNNRLPWLKPVQ